MESRDFNLYWMEIENETNQFISKITPDFEEVVSGYKGFDYVKWVANFFQRIQPYYRIKLGISPLSLSLSSAANILERSQMKEFTQSNFVSNDPILSVKYMATEAYNTDLFVTILEETEEKVLKPALESMKHEFTVISKRVAEVEAKVFMGDEEPMEHRRLAHELEMDKKKKEKIFVAIENVKECLKVLDNKEEAINSVRHTLSTGK